MPHVVVLATGGTIAGLRSGSGYRSGQLDGSRLLQSVDTTVAGLQVSVEDIANLGSQDMDHACWFKLAAHIARLDSQGDVDGIVVTHGTDTMEETAFFLSRVLAPSINIVLTGAMRPSDAPDADGPANLHGALALASGKPVGGQGRVWVAMGGSIHSSDWVQKVSASELEAFAAPGYCALGHVHGDSVRWQPGVNHQPARHVYALPASPDALPKVGILYAHAGMDVRQVQACLALGWDGWVLAGVGNGNAHHACLAALAEAAAAGVAVVRSRRAAAGMVTTDGEVDDCSLGFIPAGPYTAVQSRILLMLALQGSRQPDQLREHFL